jgi:5-methyltetrahydropteroyltriglutamate--homocysteine methyltransferase
MKKWCDTNYHYIVPSISNSNVFHPNNIDFSSFDVQLQDAIQKNARNVKVSLIGPLTFLKLSKFLGSVNIGNSIDAITSSYKVIVDHIIEKCNPDYIQIEEPSLVTDLTQEEKEAFQASYQKITEVYDNILLQTYF